MLELLGLLKKKNNDKKSINLSNPAPVQQTVPAQQPAPQTIYQPVYLPVPTQQPAPQPAPQPVQQSSPLIGNIGGLFGTDLRDPTGICKMNVAGFHICDNVRYSSGIMKIILGIVAFGLIIVGDIFDIFAWLIALVPVIGDILGAGVLGNITDGIVLIGLLILIGPTALWGLGEFADILTFIPALGDIVSLIEWLPAWSFVGVIYVILTVIGMVAPKPKKQTTTM